MLDGVMCTPGRVAFILTERRASRRSGALSGAERLLQWRRVHPGIAMCTTGDVARTPCRAELATGTAPRTLAAARVVPTRLTGLVAAF